MDSKQNLRIIFVQMLFALSIGQVALRVGDLILFSSNPNSIETLTVFFNSIWNYPYAYTHLLLCFVILSTSWVGWNLSQTLGNSEKINSVFSMEYLILSVDIGLVICYFIMIRGSEINNIKHEINTPDISNEKLWCMVIFLLYLLWDILTKFPILTYELENEHPEKFVKKYIPTMTILRERSCTTIICFLLSCLVYFLMNKSATNLNTVMADLTLISLFGIFRGFKQEIKSDYRLKREQLPQSLLNQLEKDENKIESINVLEKKKKLKFIFIKVLPCIFFGAFFILYFIV